MQHDQDNGSDDVVRIVFDTFQRQNDGYFFALTAAGGMHEGLVQNKDEAKFDWDGLWRGRVSRDAGGWSAEFAIPTKTLAFDPTHDTWGFTVARAIRRKQELVRWSGISRAKSTVSLPDLGELRGLHGLRQGRGIDFKPNATATVRSGERHEEKRTELKPGFDVVWHVTPSLAGTITVNTDFADAEVDDRRVNLGRFSLFFPEKRAFFTQDASLFTFAGIHEDPLPFFSRRIGLSTDGEPIAIAAGAKVTGRVGPWTVGVLDVQTETHRGIGAQNLFVGRIAHQVLSESSVGLIATHGNPDGDGANSLVGADFDYANSHLSGGKSLTVRTGIQMTDSQRAGGRGTAETVSINYPNEPYGFSGWLSAVDRKYDPGLGFVSRPGVGNMHQEHTYNIYLHGKTVRLLQPFLETDHVTDLSVRLLDAAYWQGLYAESQRGDWLNVWVAHSRETYDEPFEIRRGILVPAGVHRFNYGQAEIGTTRSRPLNVGFRWRHGGFLTGRTNDFEATVGARVGRHLEVGTSGLLREIHLPQGAFEVRVGSAKVVYAFSPDLQLSLLAQYDNFSESLGANFRLKWIVQPGNEIFLIVNQGYDSDLLNRFRPVGGNASLKAAWTFRY